MATADLDRENWDTWDPMLIAEGLFAAANIFSNLKLVYIFSVNPHLGPLQVSLSRMMMDIFKFSSLFFLVLFAFSCGKSKLSHYFVINVTRHNVKSLFEMVDLYNYLYIRVIKILKVFEFYHLHLMRGSLMFPDSISEAKFKIG